jgi:hypothetical protein
MGAWLLRNHRFGSGDPDNPAPPLHRPDGGEITNQHAQYQMNESNRSIHHVVQVGTWVIGLMSRVMRLLASKVSGERS